MNTFVKVIAESDLMYVGNNPFDVVKTQMQGVNAKRYSSTFDCFVKIFKEEGK